MELDLSAIPRRQREILLVSVVLVLGAFLRADYILEADGDAVIRNDVTPTSSFGYAAMGDFDGDGRKDLAVSVKKSVGGEVYLIPGEALTGRGDLSTVWRRRIVLPLTTAYRLAFGDVNGDGRADLLAWQAGGVWVYHGESFGAAAAWGVNDADVELGGLSVESLAVGDINGDGRDDIAVGNWSAYDPSALDRVHVLFGRAVGPAFVDLSASADVRFHGSSLTELGEGILIRDLDGDGKVDLALEASGADVLGRRRNGGLLIYRHRADWPADWDIAVSTPDVTIAGSRDFAIWRLLGAGDFDGDRKIDLLFSENSTPSYRQMSLLPGDQWVGADPVDLGGSHPPRVVAFYPPVLWWPSIATGDWDGDGRDDLFLGKSNATAVRVHSSRTVSLASTSIEASTFDIHCDSQSYVAISLGDADGDGLDDAVFHVTRDTTSFPSSYIHVYHGFRPLTHPAAVVHRSEAASRWLRLSLSVDGDPTETRLDGDVEGAGSWRPFRAEDRALLTPAGGAKSLSVVFRNAFGRESAPVSAALDLDVDAASLGRMAVNRVRPGQPLVAECRLASPGRLTARIWSESGERVRTLWDGDAPAGLTTLTWDGADGAGNAARAGVYALTLEGDGRRERHAVLVQP